MSSSSVRSHSSSCRGVGWQSCADCNRSVRVELMEEHQQNSNTCPAALQRQEVAAVAAEQRRRIEFGKQRRKMAQATLTKAQRAALSYVRTRAKRFSDAARSKLLTKIKALGHTAADLRQLEEYIRERAPMIIHFNPTATVNRRDTRSPTLNASLTCLCA